MTLNLNWTRTNNDVNGNPRYVVHFLHLLTRAELDDKGYARYDQACARARKYRAKSYGGGIVFTSYNLRETEAHIARVLGEVLAMNSRQLIRAHVANTWKDYTPDSVGIDRVTSDPLSHPAARFGAQVGDWCIRSTDGAACEVVTVADGVVTVREVQA